ncbi:MAG: MBOAT family protein [Muribaculaceae bacterium]|nr:MBOAT family protein [Muribaculaceae bacterium]
MQFDTYIYALFLPVVFLIYWWLRKRLTWQNAFLLAASYVFYGWWDWRFLGLILITTLTTFFTALPIGGNSRRAVRRGFVAANVVVNLGILATFKYFNFFADALRYLLGALGLHADWPTLNILLPVGISFYTFQAISYTIDVYRGKTKATRQLLPFMTYIAFFPQLVAGPIERADHLMPQLTSPRRFDYGQAVTGMRQILWGLAKKVLIANTMGNYLDTMLYNPLAMNAWTIVLAAILFAIQIYADFSGYSDIAIGSARLLGIELVANFRYPYFSRSMREFWQRWHISLMSWFREYVYIPLGGSRRGKWRTCLNIMVVFALSGLWHGADATFVIWGTVNGLMLLPSVFMSRRETTAHASWRDVPRCLGVFALAAIMFLIFRANNLDHLGQMCHTLAYGNWAALPMGLSAMLYIAPFVVVEWLGRKQEFPLKHLPLPTAVRWLIYWGLSLAILFSSTHDTQQFIYFQF